MAERGRWVLLYTGYDSMAGHCEPEFPTYNIGLEALTREEAREEGRRRWKELLARGTYEVAVLSYESASYRENPDSHHSPFVKVTTYPRQPRLKYEEDVTAEFPDPLNASKSGNRFGYNPTAHGFKGEVVSDTDAKKLDKQL